MDQIGLVETDGKIEGWLGHDMLDGDRGAVSECLEQITPDAIMTGDTSLVDAVVAFSKTSRPFFFILKGNQFVGWLSYEHLHKPPLRLCLFAMLINLERVLLDLALLSPSESVSLLSPGRLGKAKETYSIRHYSYSEHGEPYHSKLLECTTIADKIAIAKKLTKRRQVIPTLNDNKLCKYIERLRNEIAHPGLQERSSELLAREDLWPFIEWAETLESELQEFLKENHEG